MANPVKPPQLRALVPKANETLCSVLIKWFKWQLQVYRWYRYAINSEGELSDEFKADVCREFRAMGGCNPPVIN